MSDLGLHEVLLAGRHQEAFGIQRPDHVVPDGAALPVVATHPSGHVLLDHLMDEEENPSLGGSPATEKTV